MRLEGPATAEGDLRRTPLAHLLVYAADRRLSGAMFLTDPAGLEHVIRFERGAPVKVRPGDGFAMFGELLIEDGLLSQRTLEHALATKGLLGDVLLLTGCVDAATLDWIAEIQFVKRMVHLFELPAETTYRYFDGHGALADWGGEPARVDLLAVLWAGLRDHGERSTRLPATLERLGDTPLRLHPAIEPGRFGFRQAELAVIARMREDAPPLAALIAAGVAPEAVVRRLVYMLAITRFLELLGAGALPVGVDEAAARALSLSGSQALARMTLRSVFYRVGAAAPDPAGDGERPPLSPRIGRRKDTAASPGEAPARAGAGADARCPPAEPEDPGPPSVRTPPVEDAEGVPSSSLRLTGGQPAPEELCPPLSKP
ncbi:MAG: hypothetical protein IT372_40770 [Polyangiaceae bacterium]|nr:hypothetical protein [Polyangiaceae bacterium]